jgi:hypothetical protein
MGVNWLAFKGKLREPAQKSPAWAWAGIHPSGESSSGSVSNYDALQTVFKIGPTMA